VPVQKLPTFLPDRDCTHIVPRRSIKTGLSSCFAAERAVLGPQTPARCINNTNSEAVRPAMAAHLKPLEPVVVCCVLRAAPACILQGAAAVCACSAITCARARGAQERPAQVPTAVGSGSPPRALRQVGCGPQVTECTKLSWALRFCPSRRIHAERAREPDCCASCTQQVQARSLDGKSWGTCSRSRTGQAPGARRLCSYAS